VLPFDALAAAGDIVHNLRSALDHLAFQLVLAGGHTPTTETAFPVGKSPREEIRRWEGAAAVKRLARLQAHISAGGRAGWR